MGRASWGLGSRGTHRGRAQDGRGLYGNHGNSRKNWHLLLPQRLIPIRKEGMAGQRGGHPGARLRGRGLGQESTGQDCPLDRKIHPRG